MPENAGQTPGPGFSDDIDGRPSPTTTGVFTHLLEHQFEVDRGAGKTPRPSVTPLTGLHIEDIPVDRHFDDDQFVTANPTTCRLIRHRNRLRYSLLDDPPIGRGHTMAMGPTARGRGSSDRADRIR